MMGSPRWKDGRRIYWTVMRASRATRCSMVVSDGMCKGKPMGYVTLCPQHLAQEFKRVTKLYKAAFEAATLYKAYAEDIHKDLLGMDMTVVPQTLGELTSLLMEIQGHEHPPTLEPEVEDAMTPPRRIGRAPRERYEVDTTTYVRRRGAWGNRTDLPSPESHPEMDDAIESYMRNAKKDHASLYVSPPEKNDGEKGDV
jgi:hypothetical protein